MKFQFLVGNDNGNSEHDIFVDGKLIRQPNVFADAGRVPWGDDEATVIKNVKDIYNNLIVSIVSPAVPTGLYEIGSHALLTYGENVSNLYVKGNGSKADQNVPYINTLAVIAARAVEKAYNETRNIPEEVSVRVDMATALPVRQHNPENVTKFCSRFMNGNHKVTVHLGITKTVDVKIKFDYVHVLPEGAPAVFALQVDSEEHYREGSYIASEESSKKLFENFAKLYDLGEIDGSYLEDKNILHIDLGDGTTDTPFTKGDVVVKELCGGINHGVGHAIGPAITEFLDMPEVKRAAYNSLSRQQFSDILKSKNLKRKDKFLVEAERAFKPHVITQANAIMKHVNDQMIKIGPSQIDIIAVYGGGSILMRDYIYPALQELAQQSRIELFYVPSEYAVTLNAEGLDYFAKSDIYKAIKEAAASSDGKK